MRKTRINAWTCLLAVVLLANLVCGFRAHCEEQPKPDYILEKLDAFIEVLQFIRQNYVDIDDVKIENLLDSATTGLVDGLGDPYSSFMPPEEGKWMEEELSGEFGGVGLILHESDNFPVVIAAIEGTPAYKAGFLPGDVILKINGKDVQGHRLDYSVTSLRGEVGTTVQVTFGRKDEEEPRTVTLTRAMIPVQTVQGARVLDGTSIGYVRITQFSGPTAKDLKHALRKLADQKITGLILDLRGNPGGLLDSAVDICSLFLPKGQPVVSVEGLRKEDNFTEISRSVPDFPNYYQKNQACPLVIMIDGGSASASEITAGCLRDLNRAVLLGEKSFGKGSVQNILALRRGYTLKLTIAKYYTPSRKVIHNKGIEPDILCKMSEEDYQQIIKARTEQERAQHDTQLQKAIEFLQNGGRLPEDAATVIPQDNQAQETEE